MRDDVLPRARLMRRMRFRAWLRRKRYDLREWLSDIRQRIVW